MSARPDRLTILASNPFFGALPENDLARIAPLLREVSVPPGDFLVREGDRAVEVFIIDDGEMQVLKRHPGDGRLQEISRLGPGQSVGELALIDEAPRSASVRALTLTRLYALAVADVAEAGAAAVIRTRLTQAVTRRLRDTNELTAQALALQLAMGRFLTFIIFLLSIYAYVLSGLSHVATRSISTTPITLGLSTLLIGVSFSMMRRLGYPLAFYGLTARGWRRALVEGVLFSIPLCAIIVAVKWVLLRVAMGVADKPVFDPFAALNLAAVPGAGAGTLLAMAAVYAFHAPLQEFLVRGALQSPLQQFLGGAGGHWSPIIASNLIFSAFHLYISLGFALVTFLPGLFWGWMYARHGTLVGVAVSHILVGLWTVFVVGIEGVV
jgi:CRP-like cAMP-binding protein